MQEEDTNAINVNTHFFLNFRANYLNLNAISRYGAKDFNSNALSIAISNQDNELMSSLLSIQSHSDAERKLIQTSIQADTNFSYASKKISGKQYSYNNIFPRNSTAIDWNCHNCHLTELRYVRQKIIVYLIQ